MWLQLQDYSHAPSKRGRYWEIHPRCPSDFPITPMFWWSTVILFENPCEIGWIAYRVYVRPLKSKEFLAELKTTTKQNNNDGGNNHRYNISCVLLQCCTAHEERHLLEINRNK